MKRNLLLVVIIITLVISMILIDHSKANLIDKLDSVQALSQDNQFDLIVYGGDPEGVVAALSGARNGLNTLLVMEEGGPGGLMVYGALNFLDLNYDDRGRIVNKGIFAEWHKLVGGGVIVDTEKAREAFARLLLAEENLTIVPVTSLREVQLSEDGQKITGLTLETNGISKSHDAQLQVESGLHPIWNQIIRSGQTRANLWRLNSGIIWRAEASKYIDASQDADLAAMAQVPFFVGGADIGLPDRRMAVTLVFRLKNVNWKELEKDIKAQKWGYSRMNSTAVWGLGKIGETYKPFDPNTKLRGLNIALQEDGTVFINALQIFYLDVLDPESLAQGMEQAKAETLHIEQFLRKNLSGFEKAELMDYPSQLYIRESRHILALYQLSLLDLIENVDFPDKIALSSYPVDYQATTPVDGGFVVFNPGLYSIPFRSLVPQEKLNLLVVGRSTGYGSLAAGSARVIPTGMAVGEAAGTAAAIAINRQVNFHQMTEDQQLINYLQERLITQGVDLMEITEINQITQDKDYAYFKELFSWGMIVAGYDNNLNLDNGIREREFAFLLMKGMKQRQADNYSEYLAGGLYSLSEYKPLYRDKVCELLLAAGGYWLAKVDNVYQTALRDGFIPEILQDSLRDNRLITKRDAYILVSYFLKRYPIPEELRKLRTRPFGE